MQLELRGLTIDELGRVELSDEVLDEIEGGPHVSAGAASNGPCNGSSNTSSCSNSFCSGSSNVSCNNLLNCSESANYKCPQPKVVDE